MKQTVMKKWVKALRSGKFKQSQGCLKDRNGHCCLGVLSAISPYKNNFTRMKDSGGGNNGVLPCLIQDWADIKDNTGMIEDVKPFSISLASMNDNGSSFEEIADFIEKHWKNL